MGRIFSSKSLEVFSFLAFCNEKHLEGPRRKMRVCESPQGRYSWDLLVFRFVCHGSLESLLLLLAESWRHERNLKDGRHNLFWVYCWLMAFVVELTGLQRSRHDLLFVGNFVVSYLKKNKLLFERHSLLHAWVTYYW